MQSEKSTMAPDDIREEMRPSQPLSKIVDWLTAAFLVLGGLLFATLGTGLYSLADRERIARWVVEGQLESEDLTDTELIDVTEAVMTWGGIGLAVTGLLVALGGVAFIVYRSRQRAEVTDEDAEPDTVTLSLVGGAVTVLTSFVPLSPILGGAVAGYLRAGDRMEGARVGAYAGVVVAIPLALLSIFFLGGFVIAAGELGLGGIAVFLGAALVFSLFVTVAFLVGLSALGGYLGVRIGERNREQAARGC